MVAVDLKLVLFFILILLLLVFGLGWVLALRQTKVGKRELAVWQTFPLGVIVLTSAEKVLFVNHIAERLLQVEGKLEETAVYKQLLEKFEKNVAVQQFPLVISSEISLDVWSGSFAACRFLFLRDMSEQRRREMALHLYWSNVSHELRTPLTSILSHLEVSRSENVPPDVQQHSLDIVYQQTQRLNNLIYSTLELGRLQAATQLDKIQVDIILIAEEAIAELILLAEAKEIGLDFHFSPPIPSVLGNPDKLKQLFINLLDNALKYCQAGDTVTVSLAVIADDVQCCVKDTGVGIPAEHLSQLTQQFYRVRRDVPGSGLGLAIVAEIVRQHNGRLHITSQTEGDERGTAVTFTIPISQITDHSNE